MAGLPSIAFRAEGALLMRRALLKMGKDIELDAANEKAGKIVADRARTLAPVLTGTLQSTIRQEKGEKHVMFVKAGRGILYAGPIHYGWPAHHIEAQPFLTDALASSRGAVLGVYANAVAAAVVKVRIK